MERDRFSLRAPAKINLYLRIVGRRPDGYHTLDTLMHKVDLHDEIDLCLQPQGIRLRCEDADLPEDRGNLVVRAAELFFATFGGRCRQPRPGVAITLRKNIPIAAGLGGGSSDAAATLIGLNELLACGCTATELAALGLRLGADVPFFLDPTPAAHASGVGEVLRPVPPLRGCCILLVNPGFPVSTRWAFQTFALTKAGEKSNLPRFNNVTEGEGGVLSAFFGPMLPQTLCNDLEMVTVARFPEIEALKRELLGGGAVAALMSGSGPTVFGVFVDQAAAERCQADLRNRFAHCWLVAPLGGKEEGIS